MQPPTIGHEKLVQCLVETARKHGADHRVFLSQVQKAPTDPLDWAFKLRVCQAAFPGVSISRDSAIKTPFQALESFRGKYTKAFLVVGSDQAPQFTERMPQYANAWGMDLEIISAGNRDSLLEGVEGISASLLREYALNNNVEKFYECLPLNLNIQIKRMVLERVKKGMKRP
jgi:hypothetical protein